MMKKNDRLDELKQLTQQLQRVRQQSLAASRNGDFRTVARLTGETARINRQILATESGHIPALTHLGDALFSTEQNAATPPEAAEVGRLELAAA